MFNFIAIQSYETCKVPNLELSELKLASQDISFLSHNFAENMAEKLVFQAQRIHEYYSCNQVPGWVSAQEISIKSQMIRTISKHMRPTNTHPSSFTKQGTRGKIWYWN
jgi:hypothetical protein